MNLAARQRRFAEAVQAEAGATRNTRLSRLFGVSNSAKIVEKGIQLGVVNLEGAREQDDAFIFACAMKFPPEDEVYFAILIRKDRRHLLERLAQMKALGAAAKPAGSGADVQAPSERTGEEEAENAGAPIRYAARNNNVPPYIARDGRIYMRNAGFWDSLDFDLTPFGPGIEPDALFVSLYPPTPSARRSLLAREFIGWLGDLVGRQKIHELRVWTDEADVGAAMRRMPATIPVDDLEAAVQAQGGHYPGGEVRRYHAALNFLEHKHYVILSGLSGTGKTLLALRYARAVHGLSDLTTADPFLFVCPVRPEWTDPTGLTGYYDVLSNRYVVPPFLEAVLVATAHRESPVFVVLDEMNLARVEYYLSDVLSCIETREPLQLHSNSVPLEGTTGSSIRAELRLPKNLFITGTINIDETTSPVSDKVLDRAIVIDMSAVDLKGFLAGLEDQEPELKGAKAACEERLLVAHGLMTEYGLGFGYRVAEEVVRYHAFAAEHLGSPAEETIDDLMVQKVLVKLRGAERQRPLLAELIKALDGLPRSQTFLGRLVSDLDEFGSFQASR
jgi:5-methylcytosine-specific restriction enzyme B